MAFTLTGLDVVISVSPNNESLVIADPQRQP
jgi:hypothetical protein